MIEGLVTKIKTIDSLSDLGMVQSFKPSPVDSSNLTIDIDIVIEHRFAFQSWCRLKRKILSEARYSIYGKPILISIDWHDDVGLKSDYSADDLNLLDINDDLSVGLFTWGILKRLNDGQIYPALYHDIFSDAYVLLKQSNYYKNINTKIPDNVFTDKNQVTHNVYVYNDLNALVSNLKGIQNQYYFLDIDLDFFAEDANDDPVILVDDTEIESFCSMKNPLLGLLYNKLAGITIALEPEYCGGLRNAFKLYSLLDEGLLTYFDS